MIKVVRCRFCGMHLMSKALWSVRCPYCGRNLQLKSKGFPVNIVKRVATKAEARTYVQEFNKDFVTKKKVQTEFV